MLCTFVCSSQLLVFFTSDSVAMYIQWATQSILNITYMLSFPVARHCNSSETRFAE